MSSNGQIIGGIVGGIVGFFTVGVVQGVAIGMSIGGYIDPPPGPNLKGPTLDDKSFQSTAYGVAIPKLYGTIATTGNIFYLENNEYKAVATTEETGGKGGGGSGTYTTTTYYATFAVALGEAMPMSRVRRIWAGGKLIYNVNNNDLGTLLQSAKTDPKFRYYDGTQNLPDSRIEAVVGVGRTPSYEGTAYIIFYDFDLTSYGNGLAGCPIKVELSARPPETETVGFKSTEFSRITDASSSRHALMPLGPFGSYAQCAGSANGKTVIRRKILGITNTEPAPNVLQRVDGSQVGFISQGYSERATYCMTEFYYDGSEDKKIAHTEAGVYENPLQSDSNPGLSGGDFHAIYDLGGSDVYFIIQVNAFQIDPPANARLLWRYSSLGLSDYLIEADIGGFGALAFDPANNIAVSLIGDGVVRVLDLNDWSIIKTFTATGAGGGTQAMIEDGYIYVLRSSTDAINSGTINISIIHIDTEITVNASIPVDTFTYSGALAPNISKRGSVLCIACQSGVNRLHFFYINLLGTMDLIAGVPLPDIVSAELTASGIAPEYVDLTDLEDDVVDGYRVTGPGSARGALGPLQVAYLFDFVERGYTLTAVKRGAEPVAEIPLLRLDARSHGESPGISIRKDYETASQLPSRYSITYLDFLREYDSNTQYADYPSRAVNERNEQMPLVITADRVAQLADVLINLAWIERYSFVFTLPQIYLHLKPAHVITVEIAAGIFAVLRINAISYTADQRLEINAKMAEPALYQSAAVGSVITPPSGLIPFVGASTAVIMDMPMISDIYDYPGYGAAVYGDGSWPGAVLFQSIDHGQTYQPQASFTSEPTVGQADGVLGASDGYVIDYSSTLKLYVLSGEFESITETQMLTGKHYCAYGAPGRWEILRYTDADLQSDDTVILSTFIRGQRGTEWATGLHENGDVVVLLNNAGQQFLGADLSAIGLPRFYKAVTIGESVIDVDAQEVAFAGINLKPLAPVLPVGERDDNDLTISWTPRTRYSNNFWHTGVQPQNEPVMSWVIDIKNGTETVRQITSTTAGVVYTEAQQIIDFGAAQNSVTVNVYQVSARVGLGRALVATL